MSKRGRRKYSKPAWELVLEVLRKGSRALSAREIAELSGVNYNTVRGRLQDLKKKGLVKKIGREWIAVK